MIQLRIDMWDESGIKNRCKFIQWILLENATHFVNGSEYHQEKFLTIKRRKGYNTAKVALAGDMGEEYIMCFVKDERI